MSFITSPGVIVPPLTAGGVAYGTGSQAKVTSAGTAGQFLQSAGAGVPTWATVASSSIVRSARTSNTILAASDLSGLIAFTSGTFTQTFTAAATLTNGWFCYLQNSGTGVITLDPDGAELIDGLTSYAMYPGEVRLVQCTGTAFFSVVLSPFTATFTSSGTFVTPPGYKQLYLRMWGGGGGGSAGIGDSSGTNRNGGGGGGGGGQNFGNITAPAAGTSITVTIGAGGAGSVDPNPNSGTGGTTTFTGYMSAFGGGNSSSGSNATGTAGGGSLSIPDGSQAGSPRPLILYVEAGTTKQIEQKPGINMGGAGSNSTFATATSVASAASFGCSEHGGSGGGGGGTGANDPIMCFGGKSLTGATGGGQGGSISSANVVRTAGQGGGVGYAINASTGYVAGSAMGGGAAGGVGAVGTAGSVLSTGSGGGGGGGGANAAGAGYVGGAGAVPGGGGGGGGAGLVTGGTGGAGASGQMNIVGIA